MISSEKFPFLIGVAGGSGAGKSFIVGEIFREIVLGRAAVVQQDWYYKDRKDMAEERFSAVNFDEPEALDLPLLIAHIKKLRQGISVEAPIYDYVKHVRMPEARMIEPTGLVLLEGTLILAVKETRNLLDLKIFINCSDKIRLKRRLKRDVKERGRFEEDVVRQWESTVLPMHMKYVEPFKTEADLVLENDDGDMRFLAAQARNLIVKRIGELRPDGKRVLSGFL